MNEEIKQLLIDCANFIQPYDDGGNEAERLMERLDKALEEGQTLPIHSVRGSAIPFVHSDNLRDELLTIFNTGEKAALIFMGEEDGEEICFDDWFNKHYL